MYEAPYRTVLMYVSFPQYYMHAQVGTSVYPCPLKVGISCVIPYRYYTFILWSIGIVLWRVACSRCIIVWLSGTSFQMGESEINDCWHAMYGTTCFYFSFQECSTSTLLQSIFLSLSLSRRQRRFFPMKWFKSVAELAKLFQFSLNQDQHRSGFEISLVKLKRWYCIMFNAVLWIRLGFNSDPDPVPDQGFDDKKL